MYKWEYLEAIADERPELEEDEFTMAELTGLQVVTTKGEVLGKVDEVLPYPAHDILKVGETLIPLVKEFVKEVDVKGGRITVELIEGMRPGEEGA